MKGSRSPTAPREPWTRASAELQRAGAPALFPPLGRELPARLRPEEPAPEVSLPGAPVAVAMRSEAAPARRAPARARARAARAQRAVAAATPAAAAAMVGPV